MSKRKREAGPRQVNALGRRSFLGGAAAGAYLVGCNNSGYPWSSDEADATDEKIVRAAIHPGIGVARVGNSVDPEGFFIGPEVSDPKLTMGGESRDPTGALKRQAARFRIYGYNAAGKIVREITADDAEITWRVQVANKKAAWYRFIVALDIPEAEQTSCPRRHAAMRGSSRGALVVDPGQRTISGKGTEGPSYEFDGGKFMGTAVSLGEARTDEAGRLLVLGGRGAAGSPGHTPLFDPNDPDTFNNADGWYDDIADGPVEASVIIGGVAIPVESSWVVVGPPNYAPNAIGWRTLYDLLVDTYVDAQMITLPTKTSFTQDVLPTLRRLAGLQWVNQGFMEAFGRGTSNDFDDPSFISKLAQATEAEAPARQRIASAFRPPSADRKAWPPLYGDAYGSFENSPETDLSTSKLRKLHLDRWAAGDFVEDWEPGARPFQTLEEVPLGQRPAMLDRAALHFCLADAFHPGCEVTWPMRHASLYASPFRIKRRPLGQSEPDYGEKLMQANALDTDGPLHAQGPGDITRWMALPWQGDTAFCRSGYEPEFDPYLQSFWPARVPNHVLSENDYAIAIDTTRPRAERLLAYQTRVSWVRGLVGSAPEQMQQMVQHFDQMGVVEARPGIANDPDFPPVMFVETLAPAAAGTATRGPLRSQPRSPQTAPGTPPAIAKAGWRSAAELEEFRRIRSRRR